MPFAYALVYPFNAIVNVLMSSRVCDILHTIMKSKIFNNLEEMSVAAAKLIQKISKDAISEKGNFTLVLSGGNSPLKLYELLATEEHAQEIEWSKTHIFWGDERCVEPTARGSNYRAANEILISKLVIPTSNIYRIPAEVKPPKEAAKIYEEKIRGFFESSEPFFDLILLGLGADGHTASLFPEDKALFENEKFVTAVTAPDYAPIKNRITMTLPLINRASNVLLLTESKDKEDVIKDILEDSNKAQARYPAALVHPQGELTWFISKGDTPFYSHQ